MLAGIASIDVSMSGSAVLGWQLMTSPPAINWTVKSEDSVYRVPDSILLPGWTRLLTSEEEHLVMASLRASSQLEYVF
jgi:hypothetical protein